MRVTAFLALLFFLAPGVAVEAKDYRDYLHELLNKKAVSTQNVVVRAHPPRGFLMEEGEEIGRLVVGDRARIVKVVTYGGVGSTEIWIGIEFGKRNELYGWCVFGLDGDKPEFSFSVLRDD